MTGVGLRRPSRVTGGHDLHPGIASMPGSISTLAALPDPLDTRSTTGEVHPKALAGAPIKNLGRDFHRVFPPTVSARETSRCSTRGLFVSDGRVIRAPQISLRRYVCQDTAQDFAKSLGLSAPLGNGVRHERQSGGCFVPNPRKVFTFAGKEDERRT